MPNLNKATTVQVLFQPKIDLSYPEVTGNSKSRTTFCVVKTVKWLVWPYPWIAKSRSKVVASCSGCCYPSKSLFASYMPLSFSSFSSLACKVSVTDYKLNTLGWVGYNTTIIPCNTSSLAGRREYQWYVSFPFSVQHNLST